MFRWRLSWVDAVEKVCSVKDVARIWAFEWPCHTVLFTPATPLVAQLAKAHQDGRLEERLTYYTIPS
jgi:hypothetical protein